MTRSRALLVVMLLLALLAAACGGSQEPADDGGGDAAAGGDEGDDSAADDDAAGGEAAGAITEIGEGEGEVSIVAWPGYIERGDTDPTFDWVTSFEEETGCTVEVKTAGTSDEMVALMQGSDEYDLVTASGDASLRLIEGGTVQPVNIDLIESWDTVDERLQEAPWHTVDGVHYGVPYQWGSNVLVYNTEVFGDEPPTSWSVVFEEQTLPDGESNAGRVSAFDGPIYIADAALYLKAHQPDLGIDDPYALTREQFDAALELLRQQRELVFRYWHDAFAQIDDIQNEGVVATSTWPFQVNLLRGEGAPVESTVPEEGATGWADTTMMHANAPHPNCAYMWLEHSLDPQVQGDLAAWFGSVPSMPAACEGNELLGDEGCETNGMGNFDRIEFWKTPQADCFGRGDGECVPYHEWVTQYIAVLGGR